MNVEMIKKLQNQINRFNFVPEKEEVNVEENEKKDFN